MAKKSNKRDYSTLYTLVKSPATLNTKCRNVLRRVLSNDEIQIEQQTYGEKSLYAMSGGNGVPVILDTNKYWAVPLMPSSDGAFFWLNYSITFQRIEEISSFAFLGTSVRVFKGMGFESSKELIFRAEWDVPKEITSEHEQPHWHVYPQEKFYLNNSPIAKDFVSLIEEDESTSKFVASLEKPEADIRQSVYKFNLSDFHFAMSSQWHLGKNIKNTITEDQLPSWLEGTVNYIITQLTYLTKG